MEVGGCKMTTLKNNMGVKFENGCINSGPKLITMLF